MTPDRKARPAGPRGRRPLKALVIGTLMIFLVGLGLVTGVEVAKGSSLSGASGTSVQRVLEPQAPVSKPTPKRKPEYVVPQESESEQPSTEPSESEQPTESEQPDTESSEPDRPDRSPSDRNSDRSQGAQASDQDRAPSPGGLLGGLSGTDSAHPDSLGHAGDSGGGFLTRHRDQDH
jgi:hypothetical protein